LIEADAWAHFRVKAFSFRLHPPLATVTNVQVVGYVGGFQDTVPGTVAQIVELLPSTIQSPESSVPTEWVRCSKSELAGPLPWYKTILGTTDPTEESPGVVVLAGGTTDTYILEMRGVFEFKTAVSSANTPLALAAKQSMRDERVRMAINNERSVLLKILSPPQVTGQPVILSSRVVQDCGPLMGK
jgi:hypothetical protein